MPAAENNKFDVDQLVVRLRSAAENTSAVDQIASILQQIVHDSDRVSRAMPVFRDNDVVLFEDNTISIWHSRFEPGYSVPVHDHPYCFVFGD